MAPARRDFTEILLRRQIISQEQLADAENFASAQGLRVQDGLVRFGYATVAEVTAALAEHFGLEFIDLTGMEFPKMLIELVPELVARNHVVLPLARDGNVLKVAIGDPPDSETLRKLRFKLNTEIVPILATQEQIQEAINRHYGGPESCSVVTTPWLVPPGN